MSLREWDGRKHGKIHYPPMKPLMVKLPMTFGFVVVQVPSEIDEGGVREETRQDIHNFMREEACYKAMTMGALIAEGPPVCSPVLEGNYYFSDYSQYIYPAVKYGT